MTLRNKYSLKYHYPVYRNGTVAFTSPSKKAYFKSHIIALICKKALQAYCALKGKYYSVYFSYICKYGVDTNLDTDYQDEGPWRSYTLSAYGDSLEELIADACISEVDQDGGELNTYSLEDAPNDVSDEANVILMSCITSK